VRGMKMEQNNHDIFLLKKLFNSSGLPVSIYKKQEGFICIPEQDNKTNIYLHDKTLLNDITVTADIKKKPVIYMEEIKILHGVFVDGKGRYFIWGPAALDKLDQMQITAYKHKHNIPDKNFHIPKSSYDILSNVMSIAFLYYCKEEVDEEEILIDWRNKEEEYAAHPAEMERYQLDKSEMNRIHNSIEFENKYVTAVEQGDVTAMKKLIQMNAMDMEGIGVVAENAVKQMEYLCVSSVLLVSRAAIRGGMNPEMAYDLSDVYLQKLEKCSTIEEMAFVSLKMQIDFTERVKQAKNRRRGNVYVEKCKDFIANHLRKPFQIQEAAQALEVNRSYLSRIFTEQEGITIQEYIARERCEHAANMLRYTDYSLAVIAEYFCFSSQSHFGKQFKNIYGMTPREYRQKNRYIDSC